MNATQITADGRTYTFTTEGAKDGLGLRTLGTLYNSRGKFHGFVVERVSNGRRTVISTASRISRDMTRAVQAI